MRTCFSIAMSQQNLSPDSVRAASVQQNCRHSVFPGRIMKVDKHNESLSSDTTSHWQNLVMPQTSLNSSSEIRSRRRRGSSGSRANEQLELDDMSLSPGAGHGHRFVSANLSQPTWCDKCGDFIWGVYKQCLICTSTLTLYFILIVSYNFASVAAICTERKLTSCFPLQKITIIELCNITEGFCRCMCRPYLNKLYFQCSGTVILPSRLRAWLAWMCLAVR